jgi:hypothetical protein
MYMGKKSLLKSKSKTKTFMEVEVKDFHKDDDAFYLFLQNQQIAYLPTNSFIYPFGYTREKQKIARVTMPLS